MKIVYKCIIETTPSQTFIKIIESLDVEYIINFSYQDLSLVNEHFKSKNLDMFVIRDTEGQAYLVLTKATFFEFLIKCREGETENADTIYDLNIHLKKMVFEIDTFEEKLRNLISLC